MIFCALEEVRGDCRLQWSVNVRPADDDAELDLACVEMYVVSFACGQSDKGLYVGVGAE